MRIYYKNHAGQTVDFTVMPYIVTEADLFDYEWKYKNRSSLNPQISRFYKELTKKTIKIALSAKTKEEYQAAWSYLLEVTERDILANIPGRLYVGEEYLLCYIFKSQKKDWYPKAKFLVNNFAIVSESGTWIKESFHHFLARGQDTQVSQETYMDYPYDYSYDYASAILAYIARNSGYAKADFKISIMGPCSCPEISIAGHTYKVDAKLEASEYLVIDSVNKKIYKVKVNGEQVNQFHLRNRESNVFQKIPEGNNIVTWDGSFSFNLTLFEGRSEPRWT